MIPGIKVMAPGIIFAPRCMENGSLIDRESGIRYKRQHKEEPSFSRFQN